MTVPKELIEQWRLEGPGNWVGKIEYITQRAVEWERERLAKLAGEPVAWQERQSRRVNKTTGEITEWTGWYESKGPSYDYEHPRDPRIEVTYEWRRLHTQDQTLGAIVRAEDAVKKRIAAYELLVDAQGKQLSQLRQTQDACREAINTLESERKANTMMTDRITELESQLAELKDDRRAGFDRVFEAMHDDPADPFDRKWSTIVLHISDLESQLAQCKADAERWRVLMELCGYWQDSSQTTVTLYQDDATRTALIKVGDKLFFVDGHGFDAAINAARKEQA